MRRFMINGLTIVVSLLICFGALEIAVRIYSQVPVASTRNFVADALDLLRRAIGVVSFDEVLGWRLADNYRDGINFTTGAYGIRMNGSEIIDPELGGVLAVGDSFTAGSGVANNETWPAQLAQLINQPVHNAACGGWAVDQMVLRAELLIPKLNRES